MRSFSPIFFLILFYSQVSSAQPASPTGNNEPDTSKLHSVIVLTAFFYSSALITLNNMWYRNEPRSSFHFFNDGNEWLKMDKAGHLFTAYQMGRAGISSLRWGGVEENKAVFYGGCGGLIFLSAVEVLDGFSSGWGFSISDMLTNVTGAGLVMGEELLWKEQRVQLKFSFHQTSLYRLRSELLGKNISENLLKDYNGQTYWLSFNIRSFLGESSKFPKWLNAAVGYGAYGMTGGLQNPKSVNGTTLPDFERYRRCFLSFDVNLNKIRTKSKMLNSLLDAVNIIKIPFPAIEYSRNVLTGYYFYF